MNAPRIIPEAVLRLQITASDPAVSAWVAANAGSGKTHVLAQRVIRLLLDGVEPGKILCITFTKAAAANMANRVFDELRRWTALDDRETRCGDPADVRPRSRSGAACARTTTVRIGAGDARWPQGTDHPRILHPASPSVSVRSQPSPPGSTCSTRRRKRSCWARPACAVLLDATLTPDAPLGRALATAITFAADRTFKEVVGEAIRKRDVVRAWIDHGGSVDAAVAVLCETLGISSDDTLEGVEKRDDRGPAPSQSALGGRRRDCAGRVKERSGTSGAARDASRPRVPNVSASISSSFSTDKFEATPNARDHQGHARRVIPSSADRLATGRRATATPAGAP